MARPESKARMGFYAIPPEVLALILTRLRIDDPAKTTILDPCCGTGAALEQIGNALGVPENNLYGIELDRGRCAEAYDRLPTARFPLDDLGEATSCCAFESVACTNDAFSLIYLNPPFDDAIGGGIRTELEFLRLACRLLARPGGVLVMVSPFRVFNGNHKLCAVLDAYFDGGQLATFPDGFRNFSETVYFGVRRKSIIAETTKYAHRPMSAEYCRRPTNWIRHIENVPGFRLLPGSHPRRFIKTEMTHQETCDAVNTSPLNKTFRPPHSIPLTRPGMTLGPGHQAMLVTSGLADGVLQRIAEPAMVVRGTVAKEEYINTEKSKVNPDTGDEKTVISQTVITTVRAVEPDGRFSTFTNSAKPDGAYPA